MLRRFLLHLLVVCCLAAPAFAQATGTPGSLVVEGQLLTTTGQLQEAMLKFNQALAIDPLFEGALWYRGLLWHALGNDDQALADIEQVQQLATARGDQTTVDRAAEAKLLIQRRQ